MAWLEVMCHPDREISFFNDATFGVAPKLDQLLSYSKAVGCFYQSDFCDGFFVDELSASGYVAINWGDGAKAILDVGDVGPRLSARSCAR